MSIAFSLYLRVARQRLNLRLIPYMLTQLTMLLRSKGRLNIFCSLTKPIQDFNFSYTIVLCLSHVSKGKSRTLDFILNFIYSHAIYSIIKKLFHGLFLWNH
jgi:hypothetical protein